MPQSMTQYASPATILTLSHREAERARAQEFGRRLRDLMQERHLKQSDLARLAFGLTVEPKTGYTVAKGRDRICAYVNGRQFPDAKNLTAIAEALDVNEGDLVPEIEPQETGHAASNFVIQNIPGRREQFFKIERMMDPRLVNKLMTIILAWDDLSSKSQVRKSKLTPREAEENAAEFDKLYEKQKKEIIADFGLLDDLEVSR